MEPLRTLLLHYFFGIITSLIIVGIVILSDYFIQGYFLLPEIKNFLKVLILGGLGFGLTHYSYTKLKKNKLNN
jgi:hypothetical protein